MSHLHELALVIARPVSALPGKRGNFRPQTKQNAKNALCASRDFLATPVSRPQTDEMPPSRTSGLRHFAAASLASATKCNVRFFCAKNTETALVQSRLLLSSLSHSLRSNNNGGSPPFFRGNYPIRSVRTCYRSPVL